MSEVDATSAKKGLLHILWRNIKLFFGRFKCV